MVTVTLFSPNEKATYDDVSHVHFMDESRRLYFVSKNGLSIDTTLPYIVANEVGRKSSDSKPETVPSSGTASKPK